MTKEEKHIFVFLNEQTLLTLATAIDNVPYCANCFYSFEQTNQWLVYKSDKDTRHSKEGLQNPTVAGTILPPNLKIGEIIGLQFQGRLILPQGEDLITAQKSYYKKYPFALAMPGDIWVIELKVMKFTNNRLGFGKKLHWQRS